MSTGEALSVALAALLCFLAGWTAHGLMLEW